MTTVNQILWLWDLGKCQMSLGQTSSIWSFESSVKASRSCRRIPSSTKKRRAPSLIVSVRSSFFATFQFLWVCLEGCGLVSIIGWCKEVAKHEMQILFCNYAIIKYIRVSHLQCWIAAHFGHVFLCKNNKVFKSLPLEKTIFE